MTAAPWKKAVTKTQIQSAKPKIITIIISPVRLHSNTSTNPNVDSFDLPCFELDYCRNECMNMWNTERARETANKNDIEPTLSTTRVIPSFYRDNFHDRHLLTSLGTNLVQNSKAALATSHRISSFYIIQRAAIPATILDAALNWHRSCWYTAIRWHCWCCGRAHDVLIVFWRLKKNEMKWNE